MNTLNGFGEQGGDGNGLYFFCCQHRVTGFDAVGDDDSCQNRCLNARHRSPRQHAV